MHSAVDRYKMAITGQNDGGKKRAAEGGGMWRSKNWHRNKANVAFDEAAANEKSKNGKITYKTKSRFASLARFATFWGNRLLWWTFFVQPCVTHTHTHTSRQAHMIVSFGGADVCKTASRARGTSVSATSAV